MANVKSKEYPIIEIKNLPNKNIVFQNLRDINTKNNVKTSTYYFKLENESTSKENQDVAFVSIDEALDGETIQDPSGAEYVALEVQDSGQIILHDKDVVLWGELCRICANPCDQFVPIFSGEGLENSLSNKIHAYLPLRVSENDDLPHQLCYNCAATLVAYDDIYRGCLDAQKRLNDLHDKLVPKDPIATETAEDENFETILEVDKNKDENEIEEVEDNNLTETQRLKDPIDNGKQQSSSTTFKEFQKTFKSSPLKMKNKKNIQDQSKPVKKKTVDIPKKRIIKKIVKSEASIKNRKQNIDETDSHKTETTEDLETLNEEVVTSVKSTKKPAKSKRRSTSTHECKICNKRFRDSYCYETHKRIHSGQKPYSCHICGKQFGPMGSLYYHLKHVHQGIKNHACPVCNRRFAMKSAMEEHVRIHTGERPFICSACGKTFRTKASLFIHGKIHTDEMNFECRFCKKLFRWKHQMINHETTHTGEKRHICDICGKGFGVKNELSRHRLTHSLEKPFSCPKCELTFGQKRYLTKHMRTRHLET